MAERLSTRQVLAQKMQAGQGGKISIVSDGRDCDECKAQAGQYRDFAGVRKPPFHPNCRCSITRE